MNLWWRRSCTFVRREGKPPADASQSLHKPPPLLYHCNICDTHTSIKTYAHIDYTYIRRFRTPSHNTYGGDRDTQVIGVPSLLTPTLHIAWHRHHFGTPSTLLAGAAEILKFQLAQQTHPPRYLTVFRLSTHLVLVPAGRSDSQPTKGRERLFLHQPGERRKKVGSHVSHSRRITIILSLLQIHNGYTHIYTV